MGASVVDDNTSPECEERHSSRPVLKAFVMVAHFVAVLFTGFIIYTAVPGSSLFSWHPTLMAIAFALLMFEGLLVFSPESSILARLSRPTKVMAHWVMQSLAVVCGLGGLVAIWLNKDRNGKPHLTSWHGIMGVTTLGYLCLQSMGGSMLKYYGLIGPLKARVKLADLKLYHATSGLLAFTLVSITLALGLFTNWFSTAVTGTAWYACLGCVAISALIVMNQITSKFMPQSTARM